jgi:hypothetical protein
MVNLNGTLENFLLSAPEHHLPVFTPHKTHSKYLEIIQGFALFSAWHTRPYTSRIVTYLTLPVTPLFGEKPGKTSISFRGLLGVALAFSSLKQQSKTGDLGVRDGKRYLA